MRNLISSFIKLEVHTVFLSNVYNTLCGKDFRFNLTECYCLQKCMTDAALECVLFSAEENLHFYLCNIALSI